MQGLRQGLKDARGARMPRTEFRTSITSPEGLGRTDIMTGHVVNVDLENYTVDVVSQFDQMRIFQIQVASPYLHPNRGDGWTVMPDIGAKCAVCWPGDSSPPFLLSFVMPHETVPLSGTEEAPGGTEDRGSATQYPTSASFAGGRPKAKPGDMFWRGRDGQFVVMHRGGVLQIGCNELAQRIYVPLSNLVLDFAENYAMHTAGGSIRWGIQEGEGEKNLPEEFKQTFRVYANDQYADLRIAAGRVHDPVPESDEDATSDQAVLELGKTEPIVYELSLARKGFKAEDGSLLSGTANLVKLRFVFDRAGNSFLRFDGNVGVLCRKRLRLRVKNEMEIFADSTFSMHVESEARVTVGGNLEITASVMRLNGGAKPVAHAGSQVSVVLPPNLLMASPAPPGFAPLVPPFHVAYGSVIDGNGTILV